MLWSLDTYSIQRSSFHRVRMHGVSNRDTHLWPLHNSSVHLTKATYVRRSGRITDERQSGWTTLRDSTLSVHPRHRHPPSYNDLAKKSLGPASPLLHRCRTLPLPLVQMEYGLLCGLWVWRRTNRRPCCPPVSNPSTFPWTAWPDGSGRWDNRMAVQHLPQDLVRPSSEQ